MLSNELDLLRTVCSETVTISTSETPLQFQTYVPEQYHTVEEHGVACH